MSTVGALQPPPYKPQCTSPETPIRTHRAVPHPLAPYHPHMAHLSKGNEEELVVGVLEPVQGVLRAMLPHPLLIGLGVQRAELRCSQWGSLTHPPPSQPQLHT